MHIDGKTDLVGVMGWPISHSFSPAMHNAALKALGLNWVYIPLPVPPGRVGDALRGLPALGFRGVNVTVPHKQAVMPFLDEVSGAAQAIGAVNTILVESESRISGFNTDWRGFLADLAAQDVAIDGRDCLVLGAGGSARAVVHGLSRENGRVYLLARRVSQAQQVASAIGGDAVVQVRPLEALAETALELQTPLVVNTTPLGMTPAVEQSVWPEETPVPAGSFFYDLVYNPAETQFMRQALAAGCRTSNGLGMLLRQGAAALALWAGMEPDLLIMKVALEKATGLSR